MHQEIQYSCQHVNDVTADVDDVKPAPVLKNVELAERKNVFKIAQIIVPGILFLRI